MTKKGVLRKWNPITTCLFLQFFRSLFWLPCAAHPPKNSHLTSLHQSLWGFKNPSPRRHRSCVKGIHLPPETALITGCSRNSGPKAFKRIYENPKVKWDIYIYININIYPLSLLLLPPCLFLPHTNKTGPPLKKIFEKKKKNNNTSNTHANKKKETWCNTRHTPQHDAPENSPASWSKILCCTANSLQKSSSILSLNLNHGRRSDPWIPNLRLYI